jgi:hypothetical protein
MRCAHVAALCLLFMVKKFIHEFLSRRRVPAGAKRGFAGCNPPPMRCAHVALPCAHFELKTGLVRISGKQPEFCHGVGFPLAQNAGLLAEPFLP